MIQTTRTHQEGLSYEQKQLPKSTENELGCLLRFYWMIVGNALAAVAAYKIFQSEGELTLADLLYWLFVVSLIAVRNVDIRFLGGRTGEGQPATMSHWRRYSLRVLGTSAAVWFVAHGLSYFVG